MTRSDRVLGPTLATEPIGTLRYLASHFMETLAQLREDGRIDSVLEMEWLEQKLAELVALGTVVEIPVEPIEHPLQEEHWYLDRVTNAVFRYVPPNFPARGVWQRAR
jgi:hypothetical protein